MKTILLLLLLLPLYMKAQSSYGDPQAYLVPHVPDTIIPVYDSIKAFMYWLTPPIPLSVQKDYVYNENYKIRSYILYDLYDEGGEGYLSEPFKYSFAYNNLGLLSNDTVWRLVNDNWQIYFYHVYTYDGQDYLLSDLYNSILTNYGWDEVHNLTSKTELTYGDSTKAYFWTYDENNNKLTELWKGIWMPDTPFRDLEKIQWAYDAENKHTGTLFLDNFDESWDTARRVTKAYNLQDLLSDSLVESFGNGPNTFTKYIYDQNFNPDSIISYWWGQGAWEKRQLELRDYDVMNRLSSLITQSWDTAASSWINLLKSTWQYDENGNLIEEKQYQNYPAGQWYENYRITSVFDDNSLLVSRVDSREESDSTHYYFNTQTIVNLTDIPLVRNLHIYPNPATDQVTFQTDGISGGTITITDINGMRLKELLITGNVTIWKPDHLSPGLYFYRYTSGKHSLMGKVILK